MASAVLSGKGVPESSGAYSAAVVTGNTCFVSGQSPVDPLTGKLVGDDVEEQTCQAFTNLRSVLEAAGFAWEDLRYVHIVLADIDDWSAVNTTYARWMEDVAELPARMIVGGSILPKGALLEVQATAMKP